MPLPFYASKRNKDNYGFPHLLFLKDLKENLDHILNKSIGKMHPDHLKQIAQYYYFAQGAVYNFGQGVIIWRRVIEGCYEFIRLAVALGKVNELASIYFQAFIKINEGIQSLFHLEEQLKSAKKKDWRVLTTVLMDKYHTLYEANIRHTFVFIIYCLDIISDHKDYRQKSIEQYFEDDLSYHCKKIENCKNYPFQNNIMNLLVGVEPNIRNAIGHKKIEFGDDYNVILTDREWKKELKYGEFERMIETLTLNYYGQITSLLMFIFDYKDEINFKEFKTYTNSKQLRILIDVELRNSYFKPKDIVFEKDDTVLMCDIEKESGFDYPSQVFANIEGSKFKTDRPGLVLREQILRAAKVIFEINNNFIECQFNLFKYDGKSLGSMIIDLKGFSKEQQEIKKFIIKDSLIDEK